MAGAGFAERLRELRQSAGLTQMQLAERAGVALRTISSLEQGLYEATWPTVVALCQALAVPCTVFMESAAEAGKGRPPTKRPRGRPRKS